MNLPTFGIVTFMRPEKLRCLVGSIRQHYPQAHIVIADNGVKLPATPAELSDSIPRTDTYVMPFDCGLSVSRNFLLNNTTGDVVILDDDFEFTAETNIEAMRDVLAEDSELGIVCGNAGLTQPMELIDGRTAPTKQAMQTTRAGNRYVRCDVADNFLLVRREAIKSGVRWNPGLKVGEHYDFFEQVKLGGKWKVAHMPDVKIGHDRTRDSKEYAEHRLRAPVFDRCLRDHVLPLPLSIVVLGVGHSGTSIVAKMLRTLGWNLGEVKEGVAENLAVQKVNKQLLTRQKICPCGSDRTSFIGDHPHNMICERCNTKHPVASELAPHDFNLALADLEQPWCVKEPRMVVTWERWQPALSKYQPLVVLVERDLERMRKTYERHRFNDFRIYGHDIPELVQMARWHYANWKGPKFKIRYEQVADAVRAFDLSRAN